jgi:hypothetical protein
LLLEQKGFMLLVLRSTLLFFHGLVFIQFVSRKDAHRQCLQLSQKEFHDKAIHAVYDIPLFAIKEWKDKEDIYLSHIPRNRHIRHAIGHFFPSG